MNIEYYDSFPTLIGYVSNLLTLDQAEAVKNFCLDQRVNKYQDTPLKGDGGTSYEFYSQVDVLGLIEESVNSCSSIKKIIYECLDSYSDQHGLPRLALANSWFNIQNKGSSLENHTHPNSVVSGALYINVSDSSSNLTFETPNPYSWFTHYANKNTKYSTRQMTIMPKTGDMILFPSWLKHGSSNNLNQMDNRVVISFNTTM